MVPVTHAFTATSNSYDVDYSIGEAGGNGSSANVDTTFLGEQGPVGFFAAAVHSLWAGAQCVMNTPPTISVVGINVSAANSTTAIEVSGIVNDTDGSAVHIAVFAASNNSVFCRGSNVTNGNSTCSFTGDDTGCSEGTCTLRVYAEEVELNACNGYDFSPTFLTVSLTYDVTIPVISEVVPNTSSIGYYQPGVNATVNFTFTETNPQNYTIVVYNSTATICSKDNTSLSGGNGIQISDTCELSAGASDSFYNVRVIMFDTAGQTITNTQTDALQIDSVQPTGNVTVNPTVTVDGTRYAKHTIPVNSTASDNVNGSGVQYVEFYANSTLIGNDSTSPYGIDWDSTTIADGLYDITIKVYDRADNMNSTG